MELGKCGVCLLGIAAVGFVGIGYKVILLKENKTSYISTYGLSDRIVKSDYAKLRISIRNKTNLLQDIQSKRKSDKEAVISFLLKCGFKKEEIEDGYFSINENTNPEEYRKKKTPDWRKYDVIDTVVVETKDVDLAKETDSRASELIDKNVFAGTYVRYLCKDIDKMRVDMIEEVAKDARVRAERIAKSNNSKITRLKYFSTGKFSISADNGSTTSDSGYYSDDESSIMKRFRVVGQASFDFR